MKSYTLIPESIDDCIRISQRVRMWVGLSLVVVLVVICGLSLVAHWTAGQLGAMDPEDAYVLRHGPMPTEKPAVPIVVTPDVTWQGKTWRVKTNANGIMTLARGVKVVRVPESVYLQKQRLNE